MHSRPDMRDSCTLPSTGRCMLPGIVPQIRAKGHSQTATTPGNGPQPGLPISVQGSPARKGRAFGGKGWGVVWSLFRREGRACGVKGVGRDVEPVQAGGARLRGEGVGRDVEPVQDAGPGADCDEAQQAGGDVEAGDDAGRQAELVDDDAQHRADHAPADQRPDLRAHTEDMCQTRASTRNQKLDWTHTLRPPPCREACLHLPQLEILYRLYSNHVKNGPLMHGQRRRLSSSPLMFNLHEIITNKCH